FCRKGPRRKRQAFVHVQVSLGKRDLHPSPQSPAPHKKCPHIARHSFRPFRALFSWFSPRRRPSPPRHRSRTRSPNSRPLTSQTSSASTTPPAPKRVAIS